jgi:cell division inhibitor SulA
VVSTTAYFLGSFLGVGLPLRGAAARAAAFSSERALASLSRYDSPSMATISQAVHQPVYQRHHASRIGKHLVPLLECPVGSDDRALVLIAPTNELKQQIGVPGGIRQIPDLVHQQQVRCRVMLMSTTQCRITVQRRQVAQQLARR